MYKKSYNGARRRNAGGYRRKNNYYNNRGRSNSRNNNRKQKIDISRFVKAAKPVEQQKYQPTHSFTDFDINPLLKRNLEQRNFHTPTQIQDQSIQPILDGKDIVGIANTGTGKTAAFLLPILDKLLNNPNQTALIVAPTRELAHQIADETLAFSKGSNISKVVIIGGLPIRKQIHLLKRRPQIVIGTPGRLKDHIDRKTLKLDNAHTIVLDEVDRMLDMGFINDIRSILSHAPRQRQSLFFSATINPTIEGLIKTFTHNPQKVMARTAETSDNVEQNVIHYYETSDKMSQLHDLLILEHVEKSLIFCETKRQSEKLSIELNKRGFKVDVMHGDKTQSQRQRALKRFRDNDINVLVATDVAARGIDVKDISHVINFDIPNTYDDYTHRIGRTGRNNKSGNAVTFVTH